mgnify:CR=1 FL=1
MTQKTKEACYWDRTRYTDYTLIKFNEKRKREEPRSITGLTPAQYAESRKEMEGEAGSFRLSKGSLLLFRSFQKTWRGPLSALLRRVLWISPPSVLVFLAMGRAHSVVLHARVGIKLRDWCARVGIELAAHRHVADRDSYLGLHSLNLLLHWHALVLGRHGRRPLWVATATALPAAVDAADDDADEEDAADGSADDERKGIVPFAPYPRQIPAVIRIRAG